MAKNSSRVFSAEEREIRQWLPPDVEIPEVPAPAEEEPPAEPVLTAEQLEQLQKQAWDEGYEQGRKEGFEYGHREALIQGREEIRQKMGRFDLLMETLEAPLEQLDDQVEQELIELVIAMVRQLVRREIRTDPGQIVGVVREALSILPVSSRQIQVLLHPEDAQLVREIYAIGESEPGWRVVEDPVLARGGCRVVTENSQIDATLETRLATLIAPLLAGERGQDLVQQEE
ncbi:MAG TPA: flagellar assembly protein FliH [Sedimenticola sp.]|nr:flagellar assembly protein FliH [Sedimenticola sp.]